MAKVTKYVLVVDDDPAFTKTVGEFLSQKGFAVEVAGSGIEGMKRFVNHRPSLVLLDICLPRIDGFQVCKKMKETERGKITPVVLTSAMYHKDHHALHSLSETGADFFLEKPFKLAELENVVENMLEKYDPERALSKKKKKTSRRELAEAGRIGHHGFFKILSKFYRARLTGSIEIEEGERRKVVRMEAGVPVFTSSFIPQEQLGRLVLEEGIISGEDYRKSTKLMQEAGIPYGEAMIWMHCINYVELYLALRRQAAQKLVEACSWTSGNYQVYEEELPEELLRLPVHPAYAIHKGARRHLETEVWEIFVAKNREKHLVLTKAGKAAVPYMELSKPEAGLLRNALAGGKVGELIGKAGRNRKAVGSLIWACCLSGVLSVSKKAVPVSLPKPGVRSPEGICRLMRSLEGEELEATEEVIRNYIVFYPRDYYRLFDLEEEWTVPGLREKAGTMLQKYKALAVSEKLSPEIRAHARALHDKVAAAFRTLANEEKRRAYAKAEQERRDKAGMDQLVNLLNPEHYLNSALCHLETGREKWAAEQMSWAYAMDPDNPRYQAYHGWCLFEGSRSPTQRAEAVGLIEKALKNKPDELEFHYLMAKVGLAKRDSRMAMKHINRILLFDPDFKDAKALHKQAKAL